MKLLHFCLLLFLTITSNIYAQYSDSNQLESRIRALDQKEGAVTASMLVKTAGGKDVFVITAGKGETDNKPGIAVIGGIQGPSLASTEIVMQMMEKLISQNPAILDEVTFYFFPCVSPDASGQYFASPRYEREENAMPYDDDRDGQTDEDGFDDLNDDNLITWMRIKDPDKGEFMIHPENPAIMVKADITKGQKGEYLVVHEGIDNDKDGKINEDLPGGVIFNKNFSFNYPYFEHGAGENSFSAGESRAIARFLFDHWNIYVVLCIGSENNLSGFNEMKANLLDEKVASRVDEKDKPYFEGAVNLYKKLTHLNDSSLVAPAGGSLLSWSYFHYNRFAFSTPAWNVSKNKNNMGSPEFDYLKLASDKGFPDQVIPWQKADHPDFPGKSVEVGGIKPFLMNNPPLSILDSVSGRHLEFLIRLASLHPALTFGDMKITKRTDALYMIEAEITNTGKFPTMTALATGSKWVRKIRLEINTSQKNKVIGGKKVFLFDRIVPGETVKAAWLVNGKGAVSLKAGSPQTGFINQEVELK